MIRTRPLHVGFITYDLQPFTEDCLWRIHRAIRPMTLKAYPVVYHPGQDRTRFPFLPSAQKGRYLGVDVAGGTPEGFASNMNLTAAWQCARESDVVVLFGLQGLTAVVASIISYLFGRILVTVNQTLPPEWEERRRWWIRWLKKAIFTLSHLNIYQTETSRRVLLRVYGVKKSSLVFAPFEAGARLFQHHLHKTRGCRRQVRQRLKIGRRTTFVLFSGTLHPFKGVACLLRAIALMPSQDHVYVGFAGPEEPRSPRDGTLEYYNGLAQQLGVSPRVKFFGRLEPTHLAELYHACDIVVLPTRKDCFPKVLVEGALAGKPIVTTNACGAAGSLVRNGINGFIVPPNNAARLARALGALLDRSRRNAFGCASRTIVRAMCSAASETSGFQEALRRAAILSKGYRIRPS